MGQDFQLKSLDGINWQPFPDVKPIGKKSNKVYKQKKKKNTPATQTLWQISHLNPTIFIQRKLELIASLGYSIIKSSDFFHFLFAHVHI